MESKDEPDRVSLDPLDPLTALKGLLAVDPESDPSSEEQAGREPTEEPDEETRPEAESDA